MLENQSNSTPYRQITELTERTNCFVERMPSDIQSLMFWFENCDNVIPNSFEIFNGTFFTTFHGVKIVLITDDLTKHNTRDDNGSYLMYYDSDYVKDNYNYILDKMCWKATDLVGRYFVDWKEDDDIITQIEKNSSGFIELNYYIES